MNCKFCNAELEEGITLCPQCGKENMEEVTEATAQEETVEVIAETAEGVLEEAVETSEETPVETPKKKTSIWVTILAIIGGIALLAVLAGAIFFGFAKDKTSVKTTSYTVAAAKAEKERDTVIATVGDRELTNSELQVYYWQVINDFYEYYAYYMDLSTLGLDLNQPLDQQLYDAENGITWQQYFLDMALNTWHRYAALGQSGKAAGYTLDAEQQAYLDSIPADLETMAVSYGYADAQDMLSKDMGAACDVAGYLRFIDLNYYVGQYYNELYESIVPSMEELETYYKENQEAVEAMGIVQDGSRYVDVRHVLIKPTGTLDEETGEMVYSDEDWEACRQKAQDLMDQWLAGDATEESFAQMAVEHSEDLGSQSLGGLYTDVYVGKMVAPFEDWCFDESRVYGDTGLVQTVHGYHIMYFVESREAWASNLQTQLINERSTTMVEDIVASYPMTVKLEKVVLSEVLSEE